MEEYLVGVDLGGTKIATGLCSRDGAVRREARLPTLPAEGPEAVIDRMVETVARVVEGVDPGSLCGVGVGAPGLIDSGAGVLSNAPNLNIWADLPLRDLLAERLAQLTGRHLAVVLANDANAAALGEFRWGAGRKHPGLRHMAYMTVSTGIGGGVIAEGRIFEGAHGAAGEIGHMAIDVHGPPCACGNVGCAEALAAGPAIARAGADLVRAGRAPELSRMCAGDPAQVTTSMVGLACAAGDRDAAALVEQVGGYLGATVVNLLHLFNPQLVVIGGGVSKMGEMLFRPIREFVARRALPATRRDLRIEPAVLGDDAGLLGAASLLL